MTNKDDIAIQDIVKELKGFIEEEEKHILTVAIMGQTGTGKSSLINALFDTRLKTDPVRPCTKEIEHVEVQGTDGRKLRFYDLPGIGESEKADAQYMTQYRQMMLKSDIVLWAVHADNRSLLFDSEALHRLLEPFNAAQQGELMSKITFVLTKADLLTSSPWVLTKLGNDSVFVPHPDVRPLLEQKEDYCQEMFIVPFKDRLKTQTYHNGNFKASAPSLSYDKFFVYYDGLLSREVSQHLQQQYPKHRDIFERLYENNRAIVCSSLFRFNLNLLMRVIIDKIDSKAIASFRNLYVDRRLDILPFQKGMKYCNMRILDEATGRIIFDLNRISL
jgi:GTP-binding protein EngB required for normal cell division